MPSVVPVIFIIEEVFKLIIFLRVLVDYSLLTSYLYTMKSIPIELFKKIQSHYSKTCRVIKSCETLDQLSSSKIMVDLFFKFLDSNIPEDMRRREGVEKLLRAYYVLSINQLTLSTYRKCK